MTLHIYRAEGKHTRRRCPVTGRLEYVTKQEFYDTTRFFFPCGAYVDAGYGVVEIPKSIEKEHRRLLREAVQHRRLLVGGGGETMRTSEANCEQKEVA